MKNRFLNFILMVVFGLAACAPVATATLVPATETATSIPTEEAVEEVAELNALPFPQHIAYATTSILPSHRTQGQLDDDVRAFYDYWKSEYLVQDGTSADGYPLYRVAFGKSEDARGTTVSE